MFGLFKKLAPSAPAPAQRLVPTRGDVVVKVRATLSPEGLTVTISAAAPYRRLDGEPQYATAVFEVGDVEDVREVLKNVVNRHLDDAVARALAAAFEAQSVATRLGEL